MPDSRGVYSLEEYRNIPVCRRCGSKLWNPICGRCEALRLPSEYEKQMRRDRDMLVGRIHIPVEE